MVEKGKIKLSISRVHGIAEYMHISIHDCSSNMLVVEAAVPLEEFARALSSCVVSDIPATFGDLSVVGKKLEVKTVPVPIGSDYDKAAGTVTKAAKKLEKDGWKWGGLEDGRLNYHKVKDGMYMTTFRRYVDAKGNP